MRAYIGGRDLCWSIICWYFIISTGNNGEGDWGPWIIEGKIVGFSVGHTRSAASSDPSAHCGIPSHTLYIAIQSPDERHSYWFLLQTKKYNIYFFYISYYI